MKNNVKFYRDFYGMSQRQLALKIGISHQEINFIESNKRIPNVIIALDIAEALNTTVGNLFKKQ